MSDKVIVDNNVDEPMTALLRVARRTYRTAIMNALREVDCGDMPKNGMYIIASIARTATPLEKIIRQLGVSKQVASQLVDSLFEKGYIERSANPNDRRRMDVMLTERGKLAASVSRAASDKIDAQLTDAVGVDFVNHTKTTLAALIDINDIEHNLPRGRR